MIIWLVIIGFLFYFLLTDKKDNPLSHKDSALEILDQRLAQGEISIEEYQELKQTLKGR